MTGGVFRKRLCDVAMSLLQALLAVVKSEFKVLFDLQEQFASEICEWKLEFLKAHTSAKHYFGDANGLGELRGTDHFTDMSVPIVPGDILTMAGWSCVSHSVINPTRREHDRVLETLQGESGKTFNALIVHMRARRPKMVLAENVTRLSKVSCVS